MKKFIIITAIIIAALYWCFDYVRTGKFQNYLDINSAKSWAPKTQYYMGYTYYILGNIQKAEFCYNRILEKYSDSLYKPAAMYGIALIYDETSRLGQAKEMYKNLIDGFPDYAKSETAKKRYNFLINF
ncbi:MAG: tol-pal system protein YbgF [Elusimicrobia bacterium ADurb.Bin231]|nr:MAG: tol-pal system protein YbgF [Elusimicrobia bacterium ADurb.Bin231]